MFVKASSLSLLALAALGHVTTAEEETRTRARRGDSRPHFGKVPYGSEILSCKSSGKIALTFDDGPGNLTGDIVKTLDKNEVVATFFMTGKNGKGSVEDVDIGMNTSDYSSLLKGMHDKGHQLASHSYSHPDFSDASYDEKIRQLEMNEGCFSEILGFIPTYFRPPYTSCDEECYEALDDMGYHVTDYDLDTKDWEAGGAESKERYAKVADADPKKDSFIVLAHDVQSFTADGFVQHMIDVGKEAGFEFTTLGECLGDPKGNWYRNPQTLEAVEPSEDEDDEEETSSASPSFTSVESTTYVSHVVSSTVTSEESTYTTHYTSSVASTVTVSSEVTSPATALADTESEEEDEESAAAALGASPLVASLAGSLLGAVALLF